MRQISWIRDNLMTPVVSGLALTMAIGIAQTFQGYLGPIGDALTWRWTPTVALGLLFLTFLLVRKSVESYPFQPDPHAGERVEAYGIVWVFQGWETVSAAERRPYLIPECPDHRIGLLQSRSGKRAGEKIEQLGKGIRFGTYRQPYCVGPEGEDGHCVEVSGPKDMASAINGARHRMASKLRQLTADTKG